VAQLHKHYQIYNYF